MKYVGSSPIAPVRAWFSRRSWPVRLLLIAALLTSPCLLSISSLWLVGQYRYWLCYTAEDREFYSNARHGFDGGLPSVGRNLKAEMEAIRDPETALQLHPNWTFIRFENGEWVFGHGIDSHWIGFGRGTLVLKDSRGRVRVFFGHVCGPNAGIDQYLNGVRTLDALDDWITKDLKLREWIPN